MNPNSKQIPPIQAGHNPKVSGRLAIGLIKTYQLTLSAIIGRTCRHLPTCSNYSIEAIVRFGVCEVFGSGYRGSGGVTRGAQTGMTRFQRHCHITVGASGVLVIGAKFL